MNESGWILSVVCQAPLTSHLVAAPATWGTALQDGVKAEEVDLVPYDLTLDYDKWTYRKHVKLLEALNLGLTWGRRCH